MASTYLVVGSWAMTKAINTWLKNQLLFQGQANERPFRRSTVCERRCDLSARRRSTALCSLILSELICTARVVEQRTRTLRRTVSIAAVVWMPPAEKPLSPLPLSLRPKEQHDECRRLLLHYDRLPESSKHREIHRQFLPPPADGGTGGR